MIGAIIGDMVGLPYEFNNIKTTSFPFFAEHASWYPNFSDDTITCVYQQKWLL